MDRREALRRLAVGGAVAASGSVVVSSPAFADGGSAGCRPVPTLIANPLGHTNPAGKFALGVTSTVTSFPAAPCGCAGWTGTVQRRWQVVSSPGGIAGLGVYSGLSTGTLLSPGFGAESGSLTLGSPVYVRGTATSGSLPSGTYVVDLTIRYVCRGGGDVAWACQRFRITLNWATSGGSAGTLTSTAGLTIGPDNSAACDSPAPTP